jgi:hypothetical protein
VKGVWFEGTRCESAPIGRTARENTTRIESVLLRIRGSTEGVVRNGGDTDTIVKGNDSLSARTPPGAVLWMLAAQAYSHDKQNNSIPVARFILKTENRRGKKIVRFDLLRFGVLSIPHESVNDKGILSNKHRSPPSPALTLPKIGCMSSLGSLTVPFGPLLDESLISLEDPVVAAFSAPRSMVCMLLRGRRFVILDICGRSPLAKVGRGFARPCEGMLRALGDHVASMRNGRKR